MPTKTMPDAWHWLMPRWPKLLLRKATRVTKATVKDLKLSRDFTIAGLVRDGEGQLVNGNTQIQAGDHVVVFCLQGAIHKLDKYFS